MAKPEWGSKRTCHNCGARFYDLRRSPIVCPTCKTAFDPERTLKARRGAPASRADHGPAAAIGSILATEDMGAAERTKEFVEDDLLEEDVEESAEAPEADEADDMEEIDAEEQDLIEDTSELGEDDDDLGEVIEHMDEDLEDKV